MNFESAVDYLKSFMNFEELHYFDYDERNFDLERLKGFVLDYGVDYTKLKFVHVGGSKGKGMVSTLIASYLNDVGKKTGLFTSPYMFDVTECFWVSGETISREKFVLYVEDLKKYIDSVGRVDITYFELLTVLVLKYFLDEKCEFAVLEVGLGGRLDSTNIVIPEVSVLTSVESEHKGILGDNLSEILDEKLGICKEGVPFVVGMQTEEVDLLIKNKLGSNRDVFFVEDFLFDVEFDGLSSAWNGNARTAYFVLKKLFGNVDDEVFLNVVGNFKMIGRLDVRNIKGKTVVFDIAHTKNSILNLVEFLKFKFPDKSFVFLVSIMKGKDVFGIFEVLSSLAYKVVFTDSHEKRGILSSDLLKNAQSFECEVFEKADCFFAYNYLLDELKKDQVLVVTGSHFLVAKLLKT